MQKVADSWTGWITQGSDGGVLHSGSACLILILSALGCPYNKQSNLQQRWLAAKPRSQALLDLFRQSLRFWQSESWHPSSHFKHAWTWKKGPFTSNQTALCYFTFIIRSYQWRGWSGQRREANFRWTSYIHWRYIMSLYHWCTYCNVYSYPLNTFVLLFYWSFTLCGMKGWAIPIQDGSLLLENHLP